MEIHVVLPIYPNNNIVLNIFYWDPNKQNVPCGKAVGAVERGYNCPQTPVAYFHAVSYSYIILQHKKAEMKDYNVNLSNINLTVL